MPLCLRNEPDQYRIVLIRGAAREVLLARDGGRLALPLVELPKFSRVAEECTSEVARRWGVRGYCLRARSFPVGTNGHLPARTILMEECESPGNPPAGTHWVPVSSLSGWSFARSADYAAITNFLAETTSQKADSEFFATPGSFQEVARWVQARAADLGLGPTGEFRQLNFGPSFSLIRFPTDGPALWFKAVGEPNLCEFPITVALAERFPRYLPAIIGTRPDWNAWLSIEAAGVHPDGSFSQPAWSKVATTLANLQIASLGQSLHLIDVGCRDRRPDSLRKLVGPFLEVAGQLMERQATDSPARLSQEELETLGAQIHDALLRLESSALPGTLGHLDFSPSNVVVDKDRIVFLDWAEAFVGHPFFTLQYLLEHFRRFPQMGAVSEPEVVAAYVHRWRIYFHSEAIVEALAVAPLLAAFNYAVSIDPWRRPIADLNPDTAKLLRSLTRRMKREAEAQRAGKVPCLL